MVTAALGRLPDYSHPIHAMIESQCLRYPIFREKLQFSDQKKTQLGRLGLFGGDPALDHPLPINSVSVC